eukprot:4015892-Pleurochrysis_carterae.AAC.2
MSAARVLGGSRASLMHLRQTCAKRLPFEAGLASISAFVQATGHELAIPMPGHAVSAAEIEQVKADVEKLHRLIKARAPPRAAASPSPFSVSADYFELLPSF